MTTTKERRPDSTLIVLAQFRETKLSAEQLLSQLEIPKSWYVDAIWITLNLVSIKLTSVEHRQKLLEALGHEHHYARKDSFEHSDGNRRSKSKKPRSGRW